jgi:16S rRNA (cytosine1402-N4)-methyltransferase
MRFFHSPVLLKEALQFLSPERGGVFVDCTLGGGGHTAAWLKTAPSNAKIVAFDQDKEALFFAKQRLVDHHNIVYIHDNFKNLKKYLKNSVDGFLFDLGVSSWQIDESSRGFSFQNDGPLDMRMDQQQKITAQEIINNYSIEELENIFRNYGEERFAKRIANAIVQKCKLKKIVSTYQLKEIIENATPGWKKRETLARIFQALRIEVNQELKSLSAALNAAIDLLAKNGRIIVISYHSLEDRIVKQTFKTQQKEGVLKILTKKPLRPSIEESHVNPRARSAKLRAGEKSEVSI